MNDTFFNKKKYAFSYKEDFIVNARVWSTKSKHFCKYDTSSICSQLRNFYLRLSFVCYSHTQNIYIYINEVSLSKKSYHWDFNKINIATNLVMHMFSFFSLPLVILQIMTQIHNVSFFLCLNPTTLTHIQLQTYHLVITFETYGP